jgi:hypothetical protein
VKITTFFLILAGPAAIQAQYVSPAEAVDRQLPKWVRFDGELRTRFEGYSGAGFRPNSSDAYILTRLKLDLTIKPTSWFKLFAEGADVRANLKTAPAPPYQNTWDLRQGYAEIGDIEKGLVGVRVGRQVITLGDQRLIGESAWSNASRLFDAVRASVHYRGYRMDLISASFVPAVDGQYDHHQQGNNIHALYGGFDKLIPKATLEPYIFWRVQHSGLKDEEGHAGHLDEKAAGFRWVGKLPHNGDYGMEMLREFGSLGQDDIHAWAGHWVAGYTVVQAPWKPRIFLEYDFASGDANAKDGIRGTFDQLYPSGHDKYGFADQVGWRNMKDLRSGIETTPRRNLTAFIEYNNWFLANRFDGLYNSSGTLVLRSPTGTAGTHIGQELDVISSWNAQKWLQLGAGFGHVFPGEFVKKTSPGVSYNYPFFLVTYRF